MRHHVVPATVDFNDESPFSRILYAYHDDISRLTVLCYAVLCIDQCVVTPECL